MRFAPTIFTAMLVASAVALIAGCSGRTQGPAPALPAAALALINHGESWMLPQAKTKTLIYAAGRADRQR